MKNIEEFLFSDSNEKSEVNNQHQSGASDMPSFDEFCQDYDKRQSEKATARMEGVKDVIRGRLLTADPSTMPSEERVINLAQQYISLNDEINKA